MQAKISFFFILMLLGCGNVDFQESTEIDEATRSVVNQKDYDALFQSHPEYISDGFDYPVGKPNAKGYYNAQGFGGEHHHLGDDWNAVTGGNSDLGHPIYAVSNGYVSSAEDHGGGWCNVLRIIHKVDGHYVESLYAHCNEMFRKKGDWVKRGDKIGTIGNCNGRYYAHLHLEIRNRPDLPLGGGYSRDTTGYIDPTVFIKKYRTLPAR